MTTFLNADAACFDAQLEAARITANCEHYNDLFNPPPEIVDEHDQPFEEMLMMLAMDSPGSSKDAGDALCQCLLERFSHDAVAVAALTALHYHHNEDRYQSGRETAFDEGAKHAH